MSEETKILYPNLRAEMARRGMTQSKLAEMIGLKQPELSRKMSGLDEFDIADITRICELFGLSFEYLFLKSNVNSRA